MKIIYAILAALGVIFLSLMCALLCLLLCICIQYQKNPKRKITIKEDVFYPQCRQSYDLDEVIARKMWEPVDEVDHNIRKKA